MEEKNEQSINEEKENAQAELLKKIICILITVIYVIFSLVVTLAFIYTIIYYPIIDGVDFDELEFDFYGFILIIYLVIMSPYIPLIRYEKKRNKETLNSLIISETIILVLSAMLFFWLFWPRPVECCETHWNNIQTYDNTP